MSFEHFVTDGTLKWFFIVVKTSQMLFYTVRSEKALPAQITSVIAYVEMSPRVQLQFASAGERGVTVIACVRPLPGVNSSVLLQLSEASEGGGTARTLVRLEAGVRAEVQPQSLLDQESFAAVVAHEDCRILDHARVMGSDVVAQVPGLPELTAAVFARVGLHPQVDEAVLAQVVLAEERLAAGVAFVGARLLGVLAVGFFGGFVGGSVGFFDFDGDVGLLRGPLGEARLLGGADPSHSSDSPQPVPHVGHGCRGTESPKRGAPRRP